MGRGIGKARTLSSVVGEISKQATCNRTIVVIVIVVKGRGESNHERQLMVVNGEGEFDQDVLVFGNLFNTKYDQLVEIKNADQCAMGFLKNVIITTMGDQFL